MEARVDRLAIELRNDPTAQGYLICYGGRLGVKGEAERLCARAKGYLSTRGISADRIVTMDGGDKEQAAVELWVVPSGALPPTAAPTLAPSEVHEPTPTPTPTPGETPSP